MIRAQGPRAPSTYQVAPPSQMDESWREDRLSGDVGATNKGSPNHIELRTRCTPGGYSRRCVGFEQVRSPEMDALPTHIQRGTLSELSCSLVGWVVYDPAKVVRSTKRSLR